MLVFQGQKQPVEALAFTQDARHLAATDGAGVSVYQLPSGSRVQRIPTKHGRPHLLTFLPTNRLVVVAGSSLWVYLEPMKSVLRVGSSPNEVAERPGKVFATPDGTRMLTVTGQHLRCWTMTGSVPQEAWVVTIGRPWGIPVGAALSPDGSRVVIHRMYGGLEYHSVHDGQKIPGERGTLLSFISRLAWAPTGNMLVGIADTRLYFVDLDTNSTPVATSTGSRLWFTDLVFHPSGRWLLVGCGDGTVRQYEPTTGAEVRSFAWPLGKVRSVAVSPDGMLAAAGGDKGQVVVWDVDE
jgi:WD40 repeat protein